MVSLYHSIEHVGLILRKATHVKLQITQHYPSFQILKAGPLPLSEVYHLLEHNYQTEETFCNLMPAGALVEAQVSTYGLLSWVYV